MHIETLLSQLVEEQECGGDRKCNQLLIGRDDRCVRLGPRQCVVTDVLDLVQDSVS